MNDILTLSLVDAKHHLNEKKISALELTDAYIATAEKNKHLNIYIILLHYLLSTLYSFHS